MLAWSSGPLIDLVESNQNYRFFGDNAERSASARQIEAIARFSQLESVCPSSRDYAICFRGSYGRGQPTAYSDIDVLLIASSPHRSMEWIRTLLDKLLPGKAISIWRIAFYGEYKWSRRLEFWHCLPHLRFVTGDIDLYHEFILTARRGLSDLRFEQLLTDHALEFNDCEWDNPRSPHFYDMKKGCGGLLEHEFADLICAWQLAKEVPLREAQISSGKVIHRHYRYITLLRQYLCQELIRPVATRQVNTLGLKPTRTHWFFHSLNLVRTMALEAHSCIAQFIGQLPTGLKYNWVQTSYLPKKGKWTMPDNKPMAFLSYAREDYERVDEDSNSLSTASDIDWLQNQLTGEVLLRTGRLLHLFFDQEDIQAGENWQERIEEALSSSLILIMLITPAFLKSKNCLREYELFEIREAQLQRRDLIIPIYFSDSVWFNVGTSGWPGRWIKDIKERQYVDWRAVRGDKTSRDSLKTIENLARRIQNVLSDLLPSTLREGNRAQRLIGVPQPGAKDFADWIEFVFMRLSRTQKHIMYTLYVKPRDSEILLDELAEIILLKQEVAYIANVSELHYRVKDLAYQGLLDLHVVGTRRTSVGCSPAVRNALEVKGLLAWTETDHDSPAE